MTAGLAETTDQRAVAAQITGPRWKYRRKIGDEWSSELQGERHSD